MYELAERLKTEVIKIHEKKPAARRQPSEEKIKGKNEGGSIELVGGGVSKKDKKGAKTRKYLEAIRGQNLRNHPANLCSDPETFKSISRTDARHGG